MTKQSAQSKTPTVTITSGQLSGTWTGSKKDQPQIAIFNGIPYAAPPVGELRWRPPQPVEPWTKIRKATATGPSAWQRAGDVDVFLTGLIEGQGWGRLRTALVKRLATLASPKQDEDCLYLNVYTPTLDNKAKLPVMVWIHGGDHQDGSGSDPIYTSTTLAKQGIVYVSINYRLGLLGYFAHPELTAESEQEIGHSVSGNYGTLDQIAALKWVRSNIAAFGGDPDNVTIFGESAGGESVAHMMTSPLAEGLFHRAIMQSPANAGQMIHLSRRFLDHLSGEEIGLEFAAQLGLDPEDQIAQLRSMSGKKLMKRLCTSTGTTSFYPLIDGYVLPYSPFKAFYEGKQAAVPLMVGSNADEGTAIYPIMGMPLGEYKNRIIPETVMPNYMHEVYQGDIDTLVELYPGLDKRDRNAESVFLGDEFFGAKARFYAEHSAKAGAPSYLYMFRRVPPSPKQTAGAYHAAELAFVHDSGNAIFPMNKADLALSEQMVQYWTQFAKTGNPNGDSDPGAALADWCAFSADNPQWMSFDVDNVVYEATEREEKYAILNRRLERLIAEMTD